MDVRKIFICDGHNRVKERSESHPPLQPVDGDMVGFVGDVECRQTQVGEIPEKLWGKKSRSIRYI